LLASADPKNPAAPVIKNRIWSQKGMNSIIAQPYFEHFQIEKRVLKVDSGLELKKFSQDLRNSFEKSPASFHWYIHNFLGDTFPIGHGASVNDGCIPRSIGFRLPAGILPF
jgi:hypothetical protein